MDTRSKCSDVTFRIQERLLREARQELGDERAKVKILKEQLAAEETTVSELRYKFDKERNEFGEALMAKDAFITMLKNRVDSVNRDYNRAYNTTASPPPSSSSQN